VHKRLLSKPCLILIMGVAGSGKTTLAREILRHIGAVYLDNNHVVDAFFPDTRSGRNYEKLRPSFYQVLYTIAEENLRVGNSILLDVPHVKEVRIPKWRRFIKRLAAHTKAKVIFIRCFCSEKVLHSRIRVRNEKRDRWKLAHWKEFLIQQPVKLALPFEHLDIDTEKNLVANARAAIRYILNSGTKSSKIEV
jgi:predicted kinase